MIYIAGIIGIFFLIYNSVTYFDMQKRHAVFFQKAKEMKEVGSPSSEAGKYYKTHFPDSYERLIKEIRNIIVLTFMFIASTLLVNWQITICYLLWAFLVGKFVPDGSKMWTRIVHATTTIFLICYNIYVSSLIWGFKIF